MSSDDLLRALRNKRILARLPFVEKGFWPGPEPVVKIPATSVIVTRDTREFYITLEDLTKLVGGVLQSA